MADDLTRPEIRITKEQALEAIEKLIDGWYSILGRMDQMDGTILARVIEAAGESLAILAAFAVAFPMDSQVQQAVGRATRLVTFVMTEATTLLKDLAADGKEVVTTPISELMEKIEKYGPNGPFIDETTPEN